MLADSAQEVGGKLYILGGGWSVTGPVVPPSAVAIKIDVPLAVNFGPLPLRPGTRYVWELSIDGRLDEDWNRQFLVRES